MNQIEIDDLFKGAYFLCHSGQLRDIRVTDNHQVRFVIEGEGLLEAERRFYTGKALVNPLLLRESLNYLRDLLKRTLDKNRIKNLNGRREKHETKRHGGKARY